MSRYSNINDEDEELYLDIKHETAYAYLINNIGKDIWIPKSQVRELDNKSAAHCSSRFVIPHWLAVAKELV